MNSNNNTHSQKAYSIIFSCVFLFYSPFMCSASHCLLLLLVARNNSSSTFGHIVSQQSSRLSRGTLTIREQLFKCVYSVSIDGCYRLVSCNQSIAVDALVFNACLVIDLSKIISWHKRQHLYYMCRLFHITSYSLCVCFYIMWMSEPEQLCMVFEVRITSFVNRAKIKIGIS